MKNFLNKIKNLRLWRILGAAFRRVGTVFRKIWGAIRRFFGFLGRHWRAVTLIAVAVILAVGTFLALFLTLPVKCVEIEGEVILLQGEKYAGGLNVKQTTKAGLVHREDVLPDMLSDFDPDVAGDQEVTVAYGKWRVKATVKVLALTEVELRLREGSLPREYEPNDPLPPTGILDLYYQNERIRSVPVTRAIAPGFTTRLSDDYSILLTYRPGLSVRYDYTVLEVIESIEPIGVLYAAQGKEPSKQNAMGNMRFRVKYKDGTQEDVMIYSEMLSVKAGEAFEVKGEDYASTMTFVYKGFEVSCPVTAYSGELLAPSEVKLILDQSVYIEGQPFDYTKAHLEVRYERFPDTPVLLLSTVDEILLLRQVGDVESGIFAPITDGTEPIIFGEAGYYYLIAQYFGVDSDRLTLRVISEEDIDRVTGLSTTWHGFPTGMPKKGQELDCTDATLDVIYGFGYSKETVPLTLDMVSGYDKNKVGDQTLRITYEEYYYDVPIRVADPDSEEVTYVYDVVGWNEPTYYSSESLVIPEAAYLDVEIGYGTRIRVPLTDEGVEITGFEPQTLGEQILTITYEVFTVTQPLELIDDRVDEIVDFWAPYDIVVNVGEELDLTGECTLFYTRRSETMTLADVLDAGGRMTGEYDLAKPGDYPVRFYHPDYDGTDHATWIHVVSDLPIMMGVRLDLSDENAKTTYNVGDSLDLTGMKLWLRYSDGSEVDITEELYDGMFTGFYTSTVGNRTATVIYVGEEGEFTTGYDYRVE